MIDHPVCVARIAEDGANIDLMLNNAREPTLFLSRPDWDRDEGRIGIGMAVDREPSRKLEGDAVADVVVVTLSDDALVKRLRRARLVLWSLPSGRFRTGIAKFGAALDAVKRCNARDDRAFAGKAH
ncbi:MAG: hypothetical protein JO013_16655 [Alphaproteobacteria bacterium]|nr:hypothetical protein [Alphaproteobacteria bacterium]